MPVNVIGTLKPKNNGKFPVAEAVDIKVTDDLRLDEALENKADLATVNFALNNKADKTTAANLQSQIDEIITPVTQDAEVQNARVGADGTSYQTLKARLDAESSALNEDLAQIAEVLTRYDVEQGVWQNGSKVAEPKRLRTKEKLILPIGTTIEVNPKGLYLNIIQFETADLTTAAETTGWFGGDSNVRRISVKAKYVAVNFATASTYAEASTITPADYVCEFKCIKTTLVEELTKRVEAIGITITKDDIEQGVWQKGSKVAEPIRIRNNKKLHLPIGATLEINPKGLFVQVVQYETEISTTKTSDTGWFGGDSNVHFVKVGGYVVINIANAQTYGESTAISVNDYVCEIKCLETYLIDKIEKDISNALTIDIFNLAYQKTNHYAYDTNGTLSIDSSLKWTAYWYDATKIQSIAQIQSNIVYTNQMRYVQFAFFSTTTPSNASKIQYYCYDINGENVVDNIPVPENAVLAIMFVRNANITGLETIKGTYEGTISDIKKDVDELMKDAEIKSGYSYSGERIKLDNYFRYNPLAINGMGQDGCVYGDYIFCFDNAGSCRVYDLLSKAIVTNFSLGGSAVPHCNATFFGADKYDDGDDFPLLYVNAYNAPDTPRGTLYVHRILTDSEGLPTGTELLQTITVGFTEDSIWDDGNNLSPYGNFFVDTDNGFLYAYVPKTTQNVTRFFKFPLPDISIGSVTLEESDIIEYFDTDYILYPQGNCYNSGKAYIVSGIAEGTGFLSVVSLTSKRIVSRIDFFKSIGASWEPELIDVYKGNLIMGYGALYEFEF